jgi:hypothetical protein
MMQFLFEHPEGIAIWLVPVQSITWGVTVDNILKTQGASALRPYHESMADTTRTKATNIHKKQDAMTILEKDFYAFHLPQTCQLNREEEEAKLRDPEGWINQRIYSLQYNTKIGVRKRYGQDHVLTYMANTHLIIKHYDRLQIDLHSFRKAINTVVQPYYAALGHRVYHKRPYMSIGKSVYVRYHILDNSLVHDFLVAYIEKAKEDAAILLQQQQQQQQRQQQQQQQDEDMSIVNSPVNSPIDAGLDLADLGQPDVDTEFQFGDPYVLISKFFFSAKNRIEMKHKHTTYI